jgi:alkylhydroperoxidase/carboxymuconolactone decarboxylase family protein YurZ
MDEKTSVLISIGAAVAANCVTCFRHYHAEALRIGLDEAEIDAAVTLGSKVKTGANIVVMNAVAETARRSGRQAAACTEATPSSCCSREG